MARVSEQGLTRTVFREQIKEVLLERILDGVYPPGERIVETRVAREFGVSQGPVREALREHFEYYARWVMDATPGDVPPAA